VPIGKGEPWGQRAPLPADGLVVASDAEARLAIEEARRTRGPLPILGLIGGDLCRTLGGGGAASDAEARLRSDDAMTFPVDLGEVLIDGRLHLFVAHLMAHSRFWRRSFVALNAQWYRHWDLGPRSHPGDGLLDTYDSRLAIGDLWKVRARLPTGSHLPHPGIRERRVAAVQIDFDRPLPVELDGMPVGRGRALSVRVEPDALRVVV
jgi:diacylglycerol kinase family enzyme